MGVRPCRSNLKKEAGLQGGKDYRNWKDISVIKHGYGPVALEASRLSYHDWVFNFAS